MAMRCPTLTELPSPPPGKACTEHGRSAGWPWTEESPQLPDTMPSGEPWPQVSIVTPSYNQGQFIEDAICSIKRQSYPNIEHIIVDGGSTDHTLQVIKRHEGTYNMRWLSEPDQGMYDAINKGFRISNGSVCTYLNSDDLYFPWSVSEAVANLENHHFIFGDILRWDIERHKAKLVFTPPFLAWYYRNRGVINQPTVFFRREVWDQVGEFDHRSFRLVADCDYWLRCAEAGIRPKKVFEILAIERDHSAAQRFAQSQLLKQELSRLRIKYGTTGLLVHIACRLVTHLYWRMAFLVFGAGVAPWWARFRLSTRIKMFHPRYLLELAPRRFMSRPYDQELERFCSEYLTRLLQP